MNNEQVIAKLRNIANDPTFNYYPFGLRGYLSF